MVLSGCIFGERQGRARNISGFYDTGDIFKKMPPVTKRRRILRYHIEPKKKQHISFGKRLPPQNKQIHHEWKIKNCVVTCGNFRQYTMGYGRAVKFSNCFGISLPYDYSVQAPTVLHRLRPCKRLCSRSMPKS